MDQNNKKIKTPLFEGHRRETRKSYQAYIEELTTDNNMSDPSMSADTSDDSSIRRSKRTPVPKRGFKLIDDYATKKKKDGDTSKSKQRKSIDTEESDIDSSQISQSTEDSEKEESGQARRSGRARKPKQYEDMVVLKKPKSQKDIKLEEVEAPNTQEVLQSTPTKKSAKSVSKKVTPKKIKVEPVKEQIKVTKKAARKRGRESNSPKESSDIVPAKRKKSRASSQDSQSSQDESPAVKGKSSQDESPAVKGKKSSQDESPAVKGKKNKKVVKKKTKKTKQPDVEEEPEQEPQQELEIDEQPVDEEYLQQDETESNDLMDENYLNPPLEDDNIYQDDDDNYFDLPEERIEYPPPGFQDEIELDDIGENLTIKEERLTEGDSSQDDSLNEQRIYESYVTTGNVVYDDEVNEDDEVDMKPIKLTLKTSAEDGREKTKSKKKKKNSLDKQEKRKSSEKLFVSFKKKEKKREANNKMENGTSNEEIPTFDDSLITAAIKPDDISPTVKDKEHKKSKKKKKKKDENKVSKMVDVQIYNVSDTNIVRVKKKKIFKRKDGVKVLVRITKNHCNKNDEIVKSETVIVDNVPIQEETPVQIEPSLDVSDQIVEVPTSSFKEEDANIDDPVSDNQDESFDEENMYKKPKLQPKKKPAIKKTLNKTIKKTSRPANKNVTVGGKVVGKTTKGMKKTGTAVLKKTGGAAVMKKTGTAAMKKTGNAILDMVRERQAQNAAAAAVAAQPMVVAADVTAGKYTVTEPKNAYNLFCRKYRPIIVQSHPKADFAEISKRLACLWNMASEAEKKEHRERFLEMQSGTKIRLAKINRTSPSLWGDKEFEFVKSAIQRDVEFNIPKYSVKRLEPVDVAAHFELLADSLNVIAGALEQQSAMTVHGAMSLLLDSILCAMGPLLCMTSHIPQMNAINEEQQARILDNVAYILPGL